ERNMTAVHTIKFWYIRLPLDVPIFPYTTLFRSAACRHAPASLIATSFDGQQARASQDARAFLCRRAAVHLNELRIGDLRVIREQDRKSTRLNSSHVKISYAVFCLNKKKKKNINI